MYKKRLKVALTFALMAGGSNILLADELPNGNESLLFGRSPLRFTGDEEQKFSGINGAALLEYDEQQKALSDLSGASLIRFEEQEIASKMLTPAELVSFSQEENQDSGFLSNQQRLEFANIAYKANSCEKESQEAFDSFLRRHETNGYEVKKISGTTGYADSQEESTMGLICTRGNEVIISTKGTGSISDAITDARPDRGGAYSTLKGVIFGYSDEENEKNAAITAQFLGNYGGKVHNGFLQTHNSMWPQIREELISHAAKEGVKVSDLKIETVGHSLGGALQDLNQYHLMTDSMLGYGTRRVEESFVVDVKDNEIGKGFFGPHRTEKIENKKVRGTAFEGARALGGIAVDDFNERLGDKNSLHIENVLDPVPHLPTTNGMGFNTPGGKVSIETGHNPLGAHMLGNMGDDAVNALNRFDVGVETEVSSVPMALAKYTGNSIKSVTVDPVVYAASAVVDGVYKTGEAINTGYQALFSYFGH